MAQRRPIPNDAKSRVENVRDALMVIANEARQQLEMAEMAADGKADPLNAFIKVSARAGVILSAATHGIRELEGIEGVDSPPDSSTVKFLDRRTG